MRIFVHAALGALLVLCACGSSVALAPEVQVDELRPSLEHRRATRLITHFISNFHYKKIALDDELSPQILDRYLDLLDPTRSFFLTADVAEFQGRSGDQIDDYLRNSDLDQIYGIFVRYRQRVQDRVDHALELLEAGFDFTIDEEYAFDREDVPWPASEAELNELWRRRVKNDWLTLRIAGKAEASIKETLAKRYQGLLRRTNQLNSEDVFQTFINAYTASIDPHTAYFSPRTSENFRIRMSLSLEGIGAVLQNESEYTMVREIVPGGPADKSGDLHAGDRIVAIGQGSEEEMVDVIGWRLDDVVDLIRGPKDSVVRLEVLPKEAGPEGPNKTIAIVRNRIKLEEQAAQLKYHDVGEEPSKSRFAVIEVPAFYMDFDGYSRGEKDYRSTTRDVRALIEKLDPGAIDGLIIDLRGNGGGSLTEARELTGLFIDHGPVVQVRTSAGKITVEQDNDPGIAYSGPLAVLVDRNSASASEIFAGAIQDYGRGLVIGEPTFGKGTVQNLIDLNKYDKGMDGKLGQLKETIAQFFRVAGGSTQHKGVVPDITLPTAYEGEQYGERELDNALPWAAIEPARFQPVNAPDPGVEQLRLRHQRRIAADEAFQALLETEHAINAARERTTVSLLESRRREESERSRHEQRARENRLRVARGLPPLAAMGPQTELSDETRVEDEFGLEEEDEELNDEERDAYDVVLHETASILKDLVQLTAPERLVDANGLPHGQ
jgi:carboxyl-terminal processing protease